MVDDQPESDEHRAALMDSIDESNLIDGDLQWPVHPLCCLMTVV